MGLDGANIKGEGELVLKDLIAGFKHVTKLLSILEAIVSLFIGDFQSGFVDDLFNFIFPYDMTVDYFGPEL